MQSVELIGFIAGGFVSISLLPQFIKSIKTKSTKDISISWTIINLIGQALWILYGIFINSYSLVIMSGITFIFALSLLILKIKHG